MSFDLAGKVVLVTGASSGIGKALALDVASRGAKVVVAARREQKLQAVVDDIVGKGGEAIAIPTDMADTQQVEALAQKALDSCGRVDVLVNNAGYGQMGPIESIGDDAVRQQFDVNVFGLLALTRALVPQMREVGAGRIVNLSSVAGKVAMPFTGIYNASKFAVEAISDALRVELAPFNIRVIVVEPGPVNTEFFEVAEREAESTVDVNSSPYRQVLEDMRENLTDSSAKIAWTPEQTAQTIVRAITAQSPAARYAAFSGGQLALGLMTSLPTGISDRLYSQFFGLNKLAK
ncbi:MAG: SDR family oxidoreductase [Cyanobacteria bacterium J06597_1]